MSVQRVEGEPCPINEQPLGMDVCQPCRFFRGATNYTGRPGWRVCCNWPRSGSEVVEVPIPDVFRRGMA